MELLHKAEAALADVFKGAPKLSESSRESLAKVWPWLALIGGVLNLLSAWWLYDWARKTDGLAQYANDLSRAFGGENVVDERWSVWVWIAIAMAVVNGVILLLAYPKLKLRLKSGWDLLFLAALVNVAYGVVGLFTGNGGVFSLFWSLVVTAVVLWLLFESRNKFGKTESKTSSK